MSVCAGEVMWCGRASAGVIGTHKSDTPPYPYPPASISSARASTYCTVSSLVTFLSTVRKASMYEGPA